MQPAVHQVAQDHDELVLVGLGDRGEQVEGHLPAEHGRRFDDPLLGRAEVVELAAQRLGHVPRQRPFAELVEVVVAAGLEQLLEEERVAAGAVVQRDGGAVGRRVPDDGLEELRRVGEAEAVEAQVDDGVPALEARQQLGERVPAGDLVGPVGADEQPAAGQVGHPLEEGDALRVGPVQVLEDDDRRAGRGEVADDLQPGLQPLHHPAVRVGDRLHQGRVELVRDGGAAVHGVEQQLERPAQRARVGLPAQDRHGGRLGRDQLLDQAGLADAGLPGQDRHGRRSTVDEHAEAAQLVGAPHHHLAHPTTARPHGTSLPAHLCASARRAFASCSSRHRRVGPIVLPPQTSRSPVFQGLRRETPRSRHRTGASCGSGSLVGVTVLVAACAQGARPTPGVVHHVDLALADDLGHNHWVDVHLNLLTSPSWYVSILDW